MKKLYFFLTLLLLSAGGFGQVTTESFTNLPATPINSYFTVNWTGDNGLPWSATDSRIDQVVNAGNKAIGLRFGTISCANIPNGVDSIAFTYKYLFTAGGTGSLTIRVNGNSVGTLSVPATQTTPATAIFKNFSYSGNFLLEIVEGVSGPRIAIDDIVWRSTSSTPCVAPVAGPGAVSFSNVTTNSINVSFAAASTAPDQYLAVISTAPLNTTPVNGVTYNVDDPLGNGTVEYVGNGLSFNSTGLTPGTLYYYTIFSLNSNCTGGPLYKTDAFASGSQMTTTPPVCTAPAGQVSNVNFTTISNSSLGGSFTAAPDADSYLVCYSTTNPLVFTPVNGTTYTAGQAVGNGIVTKAGVGTTFTQGGLTANTAYHFYFFPYNGAGCTGGPVYNTTAFPASASTNNNSSGIPDGYYDAILGGDTCRLIKTKLKTRTTTGMTPRSYGELLAQYYISDKKVSEIRAGAPEVLWDIYSDKPAALDPYDYLLAADACGSGEGQGWNREHSVPQSWFTGGTATGPGTDYYHIYPTDCEVNLVRGSWIYSEVSSPTQTSLNGSKLGPSAFAGLSGTSFEPINEYKGDLARAFLYFVTRYEDQMPGWTGGGNGTQAMDPTTFPSVDLPYLKLMLKWHHQDPVSQKEIDRNNAGYTYQGNRNPYVDHPEYVDMAWNPSFCYQLTSLPVDIISFKGVLNGDKVNMEWEVMNETNLLQYEVERSVNGIDFTRIGNVKATNSGTYRYSDDVNNLSGRRLYYRLKKVDTDGKFKYSEVFRVQVPLNLEFTVFPNPVSNGFARISFTKPATGDAIILVSDISGRVYQKATIANGASNAVVNLANVPAGMYLIKLVQPGNTVVQKIQVL
ncbi:MAG: endonuclease [Bacteroidota bacterium]